MSTFTVNTIGVCGAGTMGSGIAQAAAQSGFAVVLFDVQEAVLNKSRQQIAHSLDTLVSKQKISAEMRDTVWQRIVFTTNVQQVVADVIIEAIVENLDAKWALLQQLAANNADHTILASNTSSLSIGQLQQQVPGPQRVAGMHFFNPATLMKLVEVVRGEHTDEAVVQTLCTLAQRMGKQPVVCKDAPGFIVNHIARPYYLESMHQVSMGNMTMQQADTILEATGFKMGPFKLMDMIGLDINYSVSQQVWQAMDQPIRLQPSAMQQQRVEQGKLGRKTGEGFYSYPS